MSQATQYLLSALRERYPVFDHFEAQYDLVYKVLEELKDIKQESITAQMGTLLKIASVYFSNEKYAEFGETLGTLIFQELKKRQ